jgi:methionine--tRNA ligase beta chain
VPDPIPPAEQPQVPAPPSPPAAPQPPIPPAALAPPAAAPPAPEGVTLVTFDEFKRIRLVTAEVVSAVAHPKADRLVILQVKIGETSKQLVAGIRQFYAPETLVGKTIIVVDNLQPAKLRGEMSNGMMLAVSLPDGGLRLLTTDGPAPTGLRVS